MKLVARRCLHIHLLKLVSVKHSIVNICPKSALQPRFLELEGCRHQYWESIQLVLFQTETGTAQHNPYRFQWLSAVGGAGLF